MIKHVVCYKLKKEFIDDINFTKNLLLTIKDNIKEVKNINVGVDFLQSERSYDIILELVFENIQDMDNYKQSSYHVNVIKPHMHKVYEKSVSVDYEL